MKKLYTDTRTLYINGNPIDYYCIGNLRYGEPITQKTPVEDFKELCDTRNATGCFSIKIFRGFKKLKINGRVFRAEDVKDIYILKQSKERKESLLNFNDLSKELTVPEFIDFCKDRGLGVTALQRTIIAE